MKNYATNEGDILSSKSTITVPKLASCLTAVTSNLYCPRSERQQPRQFASTRAYALC